jgi:hypothetical protein
VLEIVPRKEELKWRKVGKVQPTPTLSRNTGLSGGAPDSVRCARLAGGEPTALGKTQRRTSIIHRTFWWCTGLSGEPTVASTNGRLHNPRATCGPQQRSVGYTGLSGVHRTVSGAPTTQRTNGRMRQIWKEIAHRTATVTVRWCPGLSGAPPDRRQVWPSMLASNGS